MDDREGESRGEEGNMRAHKEKETGEREFAQSHCHNAEAASVSSTFTDLLHCQTWILLKLLL